MEFLHSIEVIWQTMEIAIAGMIILLEQKHHVRIIMILVLQCIKHE